MAAAGSDCLPRSCRASGRWNWAGLLGDLGTGNVRLGLGLNSKKFYNSDTSGENKKISALGRSQKSFITRDHDFWETNYRGGDIFWVKGSVCFVLKFALPPFPLSPLECKFQNKTGT